MGIDVVGPRPTHVNVRKSTSRRHSSSSSMGSLRSPRDPTPQRSPAQVAMMRPSYHDLSPHPMTPMTPTTPTNNNNNHNMSKYSMLSSEQGHFLYPPPGDYGARFGYSTSQGSLMSSMGHGNSYAAAGASV